MFENEYTWGKAVTLGKEEEFHTRFEMSIKKIRASLGKEHPLIIDGNEHFSDKTFEVRCPSDTRIVLGIFSEATREDTVYAINSAKTAFSEWSLIDYHKRAKIFKDCATEFSKRKFDLAALLSFENGKTRYEAMGDIDETIDFLNFYSYQLEINEGYSKHTPHPNPKEKTRTVLKPYGVWGIIAPFNFPSAIAIGMTTGSLLTGNTAILKPASSTPLSSLEFVKEIFKKIPKGTINFLTGPGSIIGSALIQSQDVSGIAFTGSKEVGFSGFSQFNKNNIKPFIAEMGGKNPVIISKNADIDKAVNGVMRAAFGYGGQKCSACSRVYVQSEISDEFLKKLAEKTQKLKIGLPWDPDVFLGPVISKDAVDKFKNASITASKDGRILTGGKIIENSELHGYYVEPTIVTDLPKDHPLIKEELFLPFLCIETFDNFDEAIRKANESEYGLTAGIFTNNSNEQEEFFNRIEAGTVYANRETSATTAALVKSQPFVGWKNSGSTGKGAGGEYYLQQFMRAQTQTRCE